MQKYPFTEILVAAAPQSRGVYHLYDGHELINIGRALGIGVTIRSRLSSHLRGEMGPCTQSATHYSWEICSDPAGREEALLRACYNQYGRLPRCNDRIG